MKDRKDNNRGFSLFTVLIAVSFVAILGMLILYIAISNFNMKITGLKGKDAFYTAERALEEIRTGLQEDVGEAMSTAYTQVLESYSKESSQDATMDEQRQEQFEELFLKALQKRLAASDKDTKQYSLEKLISYVDILKDTSVFDKNKESLVITNPSGSNPEMSVNESSDTTDEKGSVVLKNLKVIYVDSKGRAAIIETDIRLDVPDVQFPTPSTLPDLMNMIVVADAGIVCEGDTTSTSTIQGSIYAGLLPKIKVEETDTADGARSTHSIYVQNNATLNIESGDKVVCAGKINVGNGSSFSSASGVNLWAKGLDVNSGKEVKLEGTTYFADDLTVSGKNNNITIAGNYYGFGSVTSALNAACYFKSIYVENGNTGADLSSAIVINGKNTTLDLSNVQKLMLAGKNYIASSKVKGTKTNASDVMTGESITVKGTQLAYLLPSELLGTSGSFTNPMDANTYQSSFRGISDTNNILIQMDTAVEAWGGKTLRELGVDQNNPVQTVFYNEPGGTSYVYFYLNFTSEANAAAFLQNYLTVNPDAKENMDKYLSFYFSGEESGISVKDADSYLRYVTGGNVLTYDGSTDTSSLQAATDTDAAADSKLVQEQIGYQNSWYALNRKMISSYDLLNTSVDEGWEENKVTHNETDSSRSVYDNLVNEKKMVEFVRGNANAGELKYVFTASTEDGGLQAIMYHNGGSCTLRNGETVKGTGETLKIDSTMAKNLRLVVCTGDVVIEKGVSFKGIIMTKGTLTLESGASLESSPLEAAKVFQSQINNASDTEKAVKAQDFFWDGDKYVLGNSTSTKSDDSSSDSYSAADCVSYENWRKE